MALRTTEVCCWFCSFGDERILSNLSCRDILASRWCCKTMVKSPFGHLRSALPTKFRRQAYSLIVGGTIPSFQPALISETHPTDRLHTIDGLQHNVYNTITINVTIIVIFIARRPDLKGRRRRGRLQTNGMIIILCLKSSNMRKHRIKELSSKMPSRSPSVGPSLPS